MSENQTSDQQQEWLLQDNLGYVALLGTAVVVVQPFLTAGHLDPSATVCVVAFAAAIPLLAALRACAVGPGGAGRRPDHALASLPTLNRHPVCPRAGALPTRAGTTPASPGPTAHALP